MALLEKIRRLCTAVNPDYRFEFESENMMNVKADDDRFPVAFFEEYSESRYTSRYGWRKQTLVELSLLKLAPMHCNATLREQLREEIESEFIIPLIGRLRTTTDFEEVTQVEAFPIPLAFDANATGIMLRFWVVERVC